MKVATHVLGSLKKQRLPTQAHVKKIATRVLTQLRPREKRDINVIFVDRPTIRRLNRSFLNHFNDTDVIAFPYDVDPFDKGASPFGDIYVCVPVAQANARLYKQSLLEELTRLIVHGLLHLLGYSDHKPKEKKRMWARQERFVQALCHLKT